MSHKYQKKDWLQIDLGKTYDIHAIQINFADDAFTPDPLPNDFHLNGNRNAGSVRSGVGTVLERQILLLAVLKFCRPHLREAYICQYEFSEPLRCRLL